RSPRGTRAGPSPYLCLRRPTGHRGPQPLASRFLPFYGPAPGPTAAYRPAGPTGSILTGSILRPPIRYRRARSGAESIERVECATARGAGYSFRRVLQLSRGGVRAVGEGAAALGLLAFTDRPGGVRQGQPRDGGSLAGFVAGRDRACAAPSGSAQRIQAAVVPGAGIGVRGHGIALVQALPRQHPPGVAGCGVTGGNLAHVNIAGQLRASSHVRMVL